MGGITHPNQYFDLSMKFYNDLHIDGAKAAAGAKDAQATQPSQEASEPAMPMAVA